MARSKTVCCASSLWNGTLTPSGGTRDPDEECYKRADLASASAIKAAPGSWRQSLCSHATGQNHVHRLHQRHCHSVNVRVHGTRTEVVGIWESPQG